MTHWRETQFITALATAKELVLISQPDFSAVEVALGSWVDPKPKRAKGYYSGT